MAMCNQNGMRTVKLRRDLRKKNSASGIYKRQRFRFYKNLFDPHQQHRGLSGPIELDRLSWTNRDCHGMRGVRPASHDTLHLFYFSTHSLSSRAKAFRPESRDGAVAFDLMKNLKANAKALSLNSLRHTPVASRSG